MQWVSPILNRIEKIRQHVYNFIFEFSLSMEIAKLFIVNGNYIDNEVLVSTIVDSAFSRSLNFYFYEEEVRREVFGM